MSYKYRVKGQRYLRKYTAEYRTPVYSAALDATLAAKSMCNVAWESVTPSKAKMPSHSDSNNANVDNRDEFDAALFCADHVDNEHRAYANAAAYVFKLDKVARKTLKSITVNVSSDPYNSNGARIAIHTMDALDAFPKDCGTCRGENEDGSLKPWAAGRIAVRTSKTTNGKEYWYPANETCKISPADAMALGEYLIVFVTMENYNVTRGNWLEGSSYIDNLVEIELDEQIEGWDEANIYDLSTKGQFEFPICINGVSSDAPAKTCIKSIALQGSGSKIDVLAISDDDRNGPHQIMMSYWNKETSESISKPIITLDGSITYFDVSDLIVAEGGSVKTYVMTIVGEFSQTSFAGVPGVLFLFYDDTENWVPLNGKIDLSTASLIADLRAKGRRIISASCVLSDSFLTMCFYICFDKGVLFSRTLTIIKDPVTGEKSHSYSTKKEIFPIGMGGVRISDIAEMTFDLRLGSTSQLMYSQEADCHWIFPRRVFLSDDYYNISYKPLGVVDSGNSIRNINFPISTVLENVQPFDFGFPYVGVVSNVAWYCSFYGRLNCLVISGQFLFEPAYHDDDELDWTPLTALAIGVELHESEEGFNFSAPYRIFGEVDSVEGLSVSLPVSDESNNFGSVGEFMSRARASGSFNSFNSQTKNNKRSYKKTFPIWSDDENYKETLFIDDEFKRTGCKLLGVRSLWMTQDIEGILSYKRHYYAVTSRLEKSKPRIKDVLVVQPPRSADEYIANLSSLYGRFLTKDSEGCAFESMMSGNVAIGFCISQPRIAVDMCRDETYLRPTKIYPCRLTAASSIIPFVLPEDKWFNSIKISKRDHSSTGGRINVWLKRDEYLTEIPDISDASYYLGDKNNVGGWELIAQLSHHSDEDDIIKIPTLKGRVATLLLTAYMPIEDVVIPTEYIEGEEVAVAPQGTDTNLDCNDVVSERLEPTISGAWKPTITLIG